eukprot:3054269-Pyramimonas_sp.AAC.1
MVTFRTASNMLTPPPSLPYTIQSACGLHEQDSRLDPKLSVRASPPADGPLSRRMGHGRAKS